MSFNIIQQLGDPQEAVTLRREKVTRQEQIFVMEYRSFVKCTPYDNHFIYESDKVGQSSFMCTCGSVSVISPPGPTGMFICMQHATDGFHTTSIINTKDIIEGKFKILKGRKWG